MITASSNHPTTATHRPAAFAVLSTLLSGLLLGCGGSDRDAEPLVSDSAVDERVENALEPVLENDFADAGAAGDPIPPADPSMEFVEGAPIPPEFPKDLPFPEGAELVGAFDNPKSDAVSMAVRGQPKELVVSLESDYIEEGWEVTGAETNGRGEGLILATKDGRSVMTLIQPDEKGNSVIKTIAIEGSVK